MLRLVAPQDRKAIGEWISGHADDKVGREIIDSLPKLPRGDGWVWAPEQELLDRVMFPAIRTFDSMRAPEDGEDHEPASWAEVDLKAITAELGEAVETAKATDTKHLTAEVARLKRELELGQKAPAQPDRKTLEAAERVGRGLGFEEGYRKGREITLGELGGFLEKVSAAPAMLPGPIARQENARAPPAAAFKPVDIRIYKSIKPAVSGARDEKPLSRAERRILTALAQYPAGRTKRQVAVLTGYAVNGGGFGNALSSLRSSGAIKGTDPLAITPEGLLHLGPYEALPTGAALLDHGMS